MASKPARPNTIRRPKDQARLVITVEVKVDMSKSPNWQSDAIDVLRALDLQPDLLEWEQDLKHAGVNVLSTKVEVAK